MSMVDPVDAPTMSNAVGSEAGVPLVSCIIVVGDDERINLARAAVTSFLRQTYPNKEIVIVNASPEKAVLDKQWPTLREYRVDPVEYPTIGSLRNKAIEEAEGEWIMPFDDDDHSHLHRMFMQMAVRRDGCCVMANKQIRVDIDRHTLCVYEKSAGIANTVLFPREASNGSLNLYDPDMVEAGEDDEFVSRVFGDNKIILDTDFDWFPGACLSIAYYHTRNKSPRDRFFGEFAGSQYDGRVCGDIPTDYLDYIKDVMQRAGLGVTINSGAGTATGPVGAASQ
jgi:glycosyltransferase involved in cell wall biosynthesis